MSTSYHNLVKFIQMPIYSKTAPDIFPRAMDVMPLTLEQQSELVYLDQITMSLNSSKTKKEHVWYALTLLLVSQSYYRTESSSEIQSATWFTSSTQDKWGYCNISQPDFRLEALQLLLK